MILAVLLAASGPTLGACAPAQPAVLRELVALVPAGSGVTVSHHGDDPFGNFDAGWEWSFATSDPSAAIATYRAWFAERGIRLREPDPDDEWPFPETHLSAEDYALTIYVPPDQGEKGVARPNGKRITIAIDVPGSTVVGLLYDVSIGPDGQLTR